MKDFEKVLKVLEIKGLSPTKANQKIGLSPGTLPKMIERQGNMHESTAMKFIRHFHVKQSWWETGKGDIFEEKGTYVEKDDNTPLAVNEDSPVYPWRQLALTLQSITERQEQEIQELKKQLKAKERA